MVIEQLLDPSSKLSDLLKRKAHLFKSGLSEDDLYRSLTELAHARDRVVAGVGPHVGRLVGRDVSRVYYDVTNYHWEIDDEDELGRRGVSKEHRPEPIVQMGMLVDRNAVPIDYRLLPGNERDGATMSELISTSTAGTGEVTWVADKGCNTKENMVDAVARDQHFLWSQSIRSTKSTAELRS